jgi:hypothetical protein
MKNRKLPPLWMRRISSTVILHATTAATVAGTGSIQGGEVLALQIPNNGALLEDSVRHSKGEEILHALYKERGGN